ncbi:magnesium transporter [Clostridium septicum]|uniref:Magnesium transporter MgtE n=1 Tax=Clostridium septicum TaxID=1504 RepID=A0A9N7PMS0_CLOSE|nr:magnesium transporter [Clostridium septicum]AYE35522.1 magnesium transporter [Clostridium septicum]MDU1314572.1 magnesium transporter [Clostridium septicum]QAS60908.1 magnesium transporter [Clostridium septicum]UEC19819.1 magnesium transporter [Clostridium septicum]USS02121.1 magnesium transporter [Clostridium septicum]
MKLEMNKNELRRFLLHAPQDKVMKYIEGAHPVDILDVLRENIDERKDILNRLSEKFIASIIDEADAEEKYHILMEFSENKQKNIVEEMSSDELTDLLGILDESQANKILAKMTAEDARMVRQLLSYDPDTAAGIMATEFISVKDNMTVRETLKYLQETSKEAENIYDLYVIDSLDKLKGVVSLRDIVTSNFDTLISDIVQENLVSIPYDMDQEEVGHIFEKYGYLTIPVVDTFNRLLGIVTVDDVMQILRDENTEDIHRLGGVAEGEKINGTLSESVKSRLPWLFINLLTAILASSIVGIFEGTIEKVVSLATFMPIVAGMGGNAGTQTLTIIVRGLALGELNYKNVKRVLFKEIGIGVITGLVIGLLIAILGYIWEGKVIFGVVIGIAMLLNMIIATISGFLVPVILKKLKVDPALASSVFVTTFTDVLGFFFFLGLATVFIGYLM